ncbi:MAG: hypothetical protein WCU80_11350 [Paludibacteraceae bacterium]
MSKNIIKTAVGIIFCTVGLYTLIIIIDNIAGSSDMAPSFEPIYALKSYLYTYSFSLGVFGTISGIIILACIICIFFAFGYWITGKIIRLFNR